MENVARFTNKQNNRLNFDLKGSSVNREEKVKMFWNQKLNYNGVLKDINFVKIRSDVGKTLMDIDEVKCKSILDKLKADTDFLAK